MDLNTSYWFCGAVLENSQLMAHMKEWEKKKASDKYVQYLEFLI